MFAANTYLIRPTTDEDAATLSRLAELDSHEPLSGRALIGQIDGMPAAAISLADGRIVADPLRCTGHLLACLRTRAHAVGAYEAMPSLRLRMLAGLPATNGSGDAAHPEHETKQDRATRETAAHGRTRRRHVRRDLVAISG